MPTERKRLRPKDLGGELISFSCCNDYVLFGTVKPGTHLMTVKPLMNVICAFGHDQS